MTTHSPLQRLLGEGLGVLFLVTSVIGSGIMADRLSGGNDGVALLCNCLAICSLLFVLITVLRPISGAHFNPVITLIAMLDGSQRPRAAAAYIVVQIGAALAAVLLSHAMFDEPLVMVAQNIRTGPAQWLSEGVASFGLIFTVFAIHKVDKAALPATVALYVFAACWFTGSAAFLNPAITIARSLTDTFTGIRPIDTIGFIAAQIAGGLLALPVCRALAITR